MLGNLYRFKQQAIACVQALASFLVVLWCPFQDLETFEIQNSTNTSTNSTNSTVTSIPGTALMGRRYSCHERWHAKEPECLWYVLVVCMRCMRDPSSTIRSDKRKLLVVSEDQKSENCGGILLRSHPPAGRKEHRPSLGDAGNGWWIVGFQNKASVEFRFGLPTLLTFFILLLNCDKTGSRRLEESEHLRYMLGGYCASGVCWCRVLMISLCHMSCRSQKSQRKIWKLFVWTTYAIDPLHCKIIINNILSANMLC